MPILIFIVVFRKINGIEDDFSFYKLYKFFENIDLWQYFNEFFKNIELLTKIEDIKNNFIEFSQFKGNIIDVIINFFNLLGSFFNLIIEIIKIFLDLVVSFFKSLKMLFDLFIQFFQIILS